MRSPLPAPVNMLLPSLSPISAACGSLRQPQEGEAWKYQAVALLPWFRSSGQPSSTTAALSLPFLKEEWGENM